MIIEISWKFIGSLQVNHILFWLLILQFDNPLKFRKNILITCKNDIKFVDDKIKANRAQYGLDREAANIHALSSKELDKHEYLTGEDLGYNASVVEKTKFEYSPLGEVLSEVKKKQTKEQDR